MQTRIALNNRSDACRKKHKNKAIVAEWFKRFWGNPYDEAVIDELGADDLTVFYPMHGPRKGKAEVKKFMAEFRETFPDLNFWGRGRDGCRRRYRRRALGRWRDAHRFSFRRLARRRFTACKYRENHAFYRH
ncbi:ester cyclase [Acetobacter sacchari]|uniref:Ester cyclase n=1 Tax=Acetobacter sacchari TaxID=2661687 RepID=A0ABS3LRW0_9PROT|nr:ester cyclase [Acetobacter sacchari]